MPTYYAWDIPPSGFDYAWSPAVAFRNNTPGYWYSAYDMDTLFQDSAMTMRVTASGQRVGAILDKSGRGFHLLSEGNARPTYIEEGNRRLIRFDGMQNWMATAQNLGLVIKNSHAFHVLEEKSPSNFGRWFVHASVTGNPASLNNGFTFGTGGDGVTRLAFDAGANASVRVRWNGSALIPLSIVEYEVTASQVILWQAEISRVTGTAAALTTANGRLFLGVNASNNAAANTNFSAFDLHEAFNISRAMTAGEVNLSREYLRPRVA